MPRALHGLTLGCFVVPLLLCTASRADGRAELERAMQAASAARSYRGDTEMESSNGHTRKSHFEFVAPDRMHLVEEPTRPGMLRRETIVVGQVTYVKMGSRAWQKSPIAMGEMLAQLRDPKASARALAGAKVVALGTQALGGQPMKVYRLENEGFAGPGTHATTTLWVGERDGFLHRTRTESDTKVMGKLLHSTVTTTFSGFNSSVRIDAPL